jgi:hypothetical protein
MPDDLSPTAKVLLAPKPSRMCIQDHLLAGAFSPLAADRLCKPDMGRPAGPGAGGVRGCRPGSLMFLAERCWRMDCR